MAKKKKYHIMVDLNYQDYHYKKIFTDWFDFADWLKQATLAGKVVWSYIDA